MLKIFVHADDRSGKAILADRFEFVVVPRIGEEIGVDQDGVDYHLEVIGVTHIAQSKKEHALPGGEIKLKCKLVGSK